MQGEHKHSLPVSRVLMQKSCRQLTPAGRVLSDALHRRLCRRFQIWLVDGMSEDTDDRSQEQTVKLGIVFGRQVSCQVAPSARHCARYGLIAQRSDTSTRRAIGFRGDL